MKIDRDAVFSRPVNTKNKSALNLLFYGLILIIYTFIISTSAIAEKPPAGFQNLFTSITSSGNPIKPTEASLRSRSVRVAFELFSPQQRHISSKKQASQSVIETKYITVNLFDDLIIQIEYKKGYTNRSGSYTWQGKVLNQPHSTAIFVVNKEKTYGIIDLPKIGRFSIRPGPAGEHIIEQIKAEATLSGEDDTRIAYSDSTSDPEPLFSSAVVEASNDNGSIIDLYVAYDQDASGGSVTASDALAYAELFVAYTNQVYENSNISQRLWLVGNVDGFNYTDGNPSSLSAELDAITDGTIAGLHAKRDEYHADLVLFFASYDNSYCSGLAWIQDVNNYLGRNTYGFSTMEACSFGQSVFAHELGHNMGSRHDWYVDNGKTPATIGHGYVDTTNRFRTMMSYSNRCAALNIDCPKVPYFSNPALTYDSAPLGVAFDTDSSCNVLDASPKIECDADNATNFNNKALITSQFRDSRITWTGVFDSNWGTAGNWTLNEGAPGSTSVVNRIPRSYDNVYIPSGLGRYPGISGTALARELVIATGATLNMSTGGTLTVGWSWEDDGGFNATGGTVEFSGPIGVSVTSSSAFNNVQIGSGSDSSVVNLLSNINIDGNLVINAGATLHPGSNSINIAGNWTEADATGFNKETSNVIFDGDSQAVSKVSNILLLSEDFSAFDLSCCTSSEPALWAESGSAYYQGDLIVGNNGAANRWRNETDGYLYTPGLNLQAGIVYQLQYDIATRKNNTDGDGSLSPQTVTIYMGSEQVSSAMTTTIAAASSETSTAYQTRTITNITVATSGTYYIGFRAQQSGDDYTSFDNISLSGVGSIAFYNLQIANGTTTFNGNVVVANNLQTENGATADLSSKTITVEGTVTNNGGLKQTQATPNSASTEFVRIKNASGITDKYFGLEITPGTGDMGMTTVAVRGNQTCDVSGLHATGISRCYSITAGSNQTASIKLYYRSAESNGNALPDAYLQTGQSWIKQITSSHGGSNEAVWALATNVTTYGTFSILESDRDGDGVPNNEDDFPDEPDEWVDTDNDGVGNNTDTDDDGDKMPDSWEIIYNLNPLDSSDASVDSDNDGFSNLQEYLAGTDPENDQSVPESNSIIPAYLLLLF